MTRFRKEIRMKIIKVPQKWRKWQKGSAWCWVKLATPRKFPFFPFFPWDIKNGLIVYHCPTEMTEITERSKVNGQKSKAFHPDGDLSL